MDSVCESSRCTGCGMCSDICPKDAINLKEGLNGFIYPSINNNICIDCGLCKRKCPQNNEDDSKCTVKEVYAAWSMNLNERMESTSGGIFSLLGANVLEKGGVVVGAAWDNNFHPKHIIINQKEDLQLLRGSKYSQSNTCGIYKKIRVYLDKGILVLFSGTPCQNDALRRFLNKPYENLITVDLVCHGVPSNQALDRYISAFENKIKTIRLRHKDPYWDYSYVRIDFKNKEIYKKLTIEDDYFNLFNIGYTLRASCHTCKYTNTHRYGDITLADFWGYKPTNFKGRNFNKGTSLIIVNSEQGNILVDSIKDLCYMEEATLEKAKKGNKCLSEPFRIDEAVLKKFWNDYNTGMSMSDLNKKYAKNSFSLPKFLWLRRIYHKYSWLIKNE
ncbi:Coenzyme F420 hydrogenase/dehydrogenase, beta subunit C-terminal domain [uncultured Phascolarctobacterium sp.]|jgi:coenzyme F420-reducing hydrogenase beta subunit|uniref:Coenzyme F420 hydrogenase/dehydrogenase, beta subunit C-terminal domain n=1 Tax=uncultured Phascolarctobacterium sp. TaxID=512296 RepID=UPI0025FFBCDF|nr:Coenzyme F420 hydrogenase/dehydrogenase, beta subunit C-terminal domain [uncultured Phascolarctobacterium sp.]